jgi:hypothetical protein
MKKMLTLAAQMIAMTSTWRVQQRRTTIEATTAAEMQLKRRSLWQ